MKRSLVCMENLVSLMVMLILVLATGCISEDYQAANQPASGIVVQDGLGNTLAFSSPPQRIAVAGADIATVLLMIGAEKQVVGVGESVKKDLQIAPWYADVASLGESSTLSPEKLVSLSPDLLLVYASSQPTNIENLKKTGIPIGYFDCYKQNRLTQDIEILGIITGHEKKAEELVSYIDTVSSLIDGKISGIPHDSRPKVYFELGDYTAAAKDSGGDWLITTAGGRNIAENTTVQWVKVTPEWIVSQNPDVIIKTGYVEPGKKLSDLHDTLVDRAGFSTIRAVRTNRTYVISSDMLYGAQSCIGLLYAAKAIHPGLFSDVDPYRYLDEFSGLFYPEGNMSEVIYPGI